MECRLYRHKIQTSYHELSRIQYLIRHRFIFCDQCVVFSNNYRAKRPTGEPLGRMQLGGAGHCQNSLVSLLSNRCSLCSAVSPSFKLYQERETERERERARKGERQNVKHGLWRANASQDEPRCPRKPVVEGHALSHGSSTCFWWTPWRSWWYECVFTPMTSTRSLMSNTKIEIF